MIGPAKLVVLSVLISLVAPSKIALGLTAEDNLVFIDSILDHLNNKDKCTVLEFDQLKLLKISFDELEEIWGETFESKLTSDQKLLLENVLYDWDDFHSTMTESVVIRSVKTRKIMNRIEKYQKAKYGQPACTGHTDIKGPVTNHSYEKNPHVRWLKHVHTGGVVNPPEQLSDSETDEEARVAEAARKTEEEAARQAEKEAAEAAEAARKAEEEAAEAARQAEEEARQAEEEARQAEIEAARQAEKEAAEAAEAAEASRQAEQEAARQAEEEAARQAEVIAARQAEKEAAEAARQAEVRAADAKRIAEAIAAKAEAKASEAEEKVAEAAKQAQARVAEVNREAQARAEEMEAMAAEAARKAEAKVTEAEEKAAEAVRQAEVKANKAAKLAMKARAKAEEAQLRAAEAIKKADVMAAEIKARAVEELRRAEAKAADAIERANASADEAEARAAEAKARADEAEARAAEAEARATKPVTDVGLPNGSGNQTGHKGGLERTGIHYNYIGKFTLDIDNMPDQITIKFNREKDADINRDPLSDIPVPESGDSGDNVGLIRLDHRESGNGSVVLDYDDGYQDDYLEDADLERLVFVPENDWKFDPVYGNLKWPDECKDQQCLSDQKLDQSVLLFDGSWYKFINGPVGHHLYLASVEPHSNKPRVNYLAAAKELAEIQKKATRDATVRHENARLVGKDRSNTSGSYESYMPEIKRDRWTKLLDNNVCRLSYNKSAIKQKGVNSVRAVKKVGSMIGNAGSKITDRAKLLYG